MEISASSYKLVKTAAIVVNLLTAILIIISLPVNGVALTPCRLTDQAKPDKPSRPSRAVFLVADKHIMDSIFRETVIFLISHDQNGAMGVIINRPSDIALFSVLPDIKGLQQRNDSLYVGGPVAMNRLLILIQSGSLPEASVQLSDNVYLSAGSEALKRIVDSPRGDERFRVYAGYAGWAPGQLEQEISRSDWHIMEADSTVIFDKAASSIWPELNKMKPAMEVNSRILPFFF